MRQSVNGGRELFLERRKKLIESIKNTGSRSGVVLLFGDFEKDRHSFRQESSFYYITGVEEPAAALMIDLESDKSTLFVPNFGDERKKWVAHTIDASEENKKKYTVDAIEYLGQPCKGYQCHPFFSQQQYAHLITILEKIVGEGKTIFTLFPSNGYEYIEQRFIIERIAHYIPRFISHIQDISGLIAQLRRTKSNWEIEQLYRAINITADAQYAAANAIKPGKIEYELQGLIEYIFTTSGASRAFPSIVGSGQHATVLHYHENNGELKNGDLVVVDIGAAYNYYCADLTRTYPVSGTFSKRQREIYNLVLEVQDYIAQMARPGFWLSNADYPDKSLNHLARSFLAQKGYDRYFIHGIGHFLGIDVHDVGDYKEPLKAGDVITIEPGIYIREENIGVRIEDNYWVVPDGVICLSEDLPKNADDIEVMMKQQHYAADEEEEFA